jgi:hypothetical protein
MLNIAALPLYVLRGEAEHVIVEPVRAHRLARVAGDLDLAAAVVGVAALGSVAVLIVRNAERSASGNRRTAWKKNAPVSRRSARRGGRCLRACLSCAARNPVVLPDVERQLVGVAEQDRLVAPMTV